MDVNGITGTGSLYNFGGVNGQNISTLNFGNQPQMPSVNQLLSLLSSKLGLNDNQMADLKNILQKYLNGNSSGQSSQTQSANNQANKTHHHHHGHRLQQMQQMNNDIKSILTPQQAQTFDQWLQSLSQQGNKSSNGSSSNSGSNDGSFNDYLQNSGS